MSEHSEPQEPRKPSDWSNVSLGTVTTESIRRNDDLALGRDRVLTVDNALGLVPSTRNLGSVFDRYKVVVPGQFAYNPMRLNVGSIALYGGQAAALVSPDYVVFQPDPSQLDPGFLEFFRRSPGWKRQVALSGQGSIRIRYYYRHIAAFEIPLPAIGEQRAIACVLRTIQQAKEASERVIASLRELKKSLLRHLFTYGVVPVAVSDKVSLRDTPYGSIPASWTVLPLRDCGFVQTGLPKGRKLNGEEAAEVPYLRVANVQDGHLDLTEVKTIQLRPREMQRYSLREADVVLTEGGDFDKLGRGFIWRGEISPCIHQNHIFAVRSRSDVLLPEYLAYLTQSGYGRSYFLSVAHKTTNLACINKTKLEAFPLPLPPLPEQETIAARLSSLDASLVSEEKSRTALASLFESLLGALMIGRVRLPADFIERSANGSTLVQAKVPF